MAIKNKRWTPRQAKFKVGTLVRYGSSLGIIVELIGASRRNSNYLSVYTVHWSVNPNGTRAMPAAMVSLWAENLLIPVQEPA